MIDKLRSLYLSVENNQLLAKESIFYDKVSLTAGQVLKHTSYQLWRSRFCPFFNDLFKPSNKWFPEKDLINHAVLGGRVMKVNQHDALFTRPIQFVLIHILGTDDQSSRDTSFNVLIRFLI